MCVCLSVCEVSVKCLSLVFRTLNKTSTEKVSVQLLLRKVYVVHFMNVEHIRWWYGLQKKTTKGGGVIRD